MSSNIFRNSCSILPQCIRNVSRVRVTSGRRWRAAACAQCAVLQRGRRYSTQPAIAPVHVEGTAKQYEPKVQQLVDEISSLTLIQVADLNELLKSTLKISDVPMMAMGMAAPTQEEAEEPEVKAVKSLFTVRLIKFEDTKKVQLIKAIKAIVAGMNLVQSKKFVESLPQVVQAELPKDDAEKLRISLTEAGGVVEVD